jgi:hypothetical protein
VSKCTLREGKESSVGKPKSCLENKKRGVSERKPDKSIVIPDSVKRLFHDDGKGDVNKINNHKCNSTNSHPFEMGPTEARYNRCEGSYERAEMHQMNCENGEYDALRVAQVRGLGREEEVL